MNGDLYGSLTKARNTILVIGGPFDGVDLYWTSDKKIGPLDIKPNPQYTVRQFQIQGQFINFLCFNALDAGIAEDWAREAMQNYRPIQKGKRRRKH